MPDNLIPCSDKMTGSVDKKQWILCTLTSDRLLVVSNHINVVRSVRYELYKWGGRWAVLLGSEVD